LFENSAAVASGVEAALNTWEGRTRSTLSPGGDGSTGDIGLQAISGMLERGTNPYVCYDNEAYMNSGVQRSGLTPFDTNTTTSHVGGFLPVHQAEENGPRDMRGARDSLRGYRFSGVSPGHYSQGKEGSVHQGPKYLQIHVPCPLGWRHESNQMLHVARMAVETGFIRCLNMNLEQSRAASR
jgi:pyruvate ferredoxin oxidoreductase beta subunit